MNKRHPNLLLLAGLTALLAACGATTPDTSAERVTTQGKTTSTTLADVAMSTAETAGSFGAWATRSFGAWASGSIGVWAVGSIGVWAVSTFEDGTANPLHDNVNKWNQIRLAQAQTLAPNLGAGITVAVIDTGVDTSHPALQGTLTHPDTWRDFIQNDNDPQEEGTLDDKGYGHGTAVAGIVLQIAPNARIMPVRALTQAGDGTSTVIADAIRYAAAQGAHVINVSAVTDKDSNISKAIEEVTLQGRYVIMAAGNQGIDPPQFPARKASQTNDMGHRSLSVGSIEESNAKSEYSNYGSDLEALAPGTDVVTTFPQGQIMAVKGTSFATPAVSGVLALALAEGYSANHAGQLASKLRSTTRNVDAANADLLLKMGKKTLGFGLLDAEAFLNSLK